jgi:MscS family membrane protein
MHGSGCPPRSVIAGVAHLAGSWAALLAICAAASHAAPAPAPSADPLGRQDPRSAVTGFLQACQDRDFQKASQYLDLRGLSPRFASQQGPERARKLEAVLNSDSEFNVLALSREPEGNRSDDGDPNREHIATITQGGQNLTLDMERVTLKAGSPPIWLFSQDTVAALPSIRAETTPALIERYLPPFLVSNKILDTALWKWLALTLAAVVLVSLSHVLDRLLALLLAIPERRFKRKLGVRWLEPILRPLRIMLLLAIFRIGIGIIDPSAISRLYIGRGMEIILMWSIAWCLIRLVDLFVNHLEFKFDTRQQLASRTMLRLARRTANALIVVLAILLVLQSWGYNTSTLVAGLGVGGIAIALAAQQTIANVFGGVSLVGDRPVRIGDFGKFGDMTGVVEDIGMRSTRIRTLNRTVVSVPNSNFAALNLENYSLRDKILFNPTFQIKRSTTEEQVHTLLEALNKLLASRPDLEPVSTPARIVGLASGAFNLEIFCYARTRDINEFYKIQGELLLQINDIFNTSEVELV